MNNLAQRGRALWGGFLIILGVVLLLQYFVDLGVWPWAAFLGFFGVAFYAFYATNRQQKWMLLPSYILLAIAAMLALIELDILRDDAVAIYVFVAIAIPFIYVYLRDQRAWWALIPAYVMVALTGLIGLESLGLFSGDTEVSYIMFTIALPFLYVYARNSRHWWALIPGGIMTVIGLAFLFTADVGKYIGPAIIILIGLWILLRGFTRPQRKVSMSGLVEDMEDMAAQIETSVEEGVAGLMEGLEDMGVKGKSESDVSEESVEEETEDPSGEE